MSLSVYCAHVCLCVCTCVCVCFIVVFSTQLYDLMTMAFKYQVSYLCVSHVPLMYCQICTITVEDTDIT